MGKFGLKFFIGFVLVSNLSLLILFFVPTLREQFSNPLIFTGFLTINIILDLLLVKLLTRPLDKLVSLDSQLQKGNLNAAWSVKAGDEIQDLGNGLSNLASHLQQALLHLEQAKQVISAERNKINVTLSSIADAVIAVDLNKNITIFNKAAQDLTGFKESEALGKPINQIFKLFSRQQEVTDSVYCPISTQATDGIIYKSNGLILKSQAQTAEFLSPKEKYINLTVGQIRQGQNLNLGCILTLHDITEEKGLADMQLEFVSMAAHELRTPLTSIKGYLSVFMDENKDKFSKDQMMFLTRINNSAQQLASLITNLLSVSRIERGSLSISLESLDWISLAKQTTIDLEIRAKEKNIDLQFIDPEQPIGHIKADKLKISEVLTNLLANAINYTPANGRIRVWVEQKDDAVVTHVQDNGPGIAHELQHHLFKKFYRVGDKLVQGTKGTGLGLYISKAIVDMHRGNIWVESELGKGATFSFSIPTYQDSQAIFQIASS